MRRVSIRRVVQSIGMLTVKELVVELSNIQEDESKPSKKEQ